MSKELNRMQELAGVPAKKETESLNEHQIGGIVGVGAINQIPPREKSDYEMAFEHFMTEGEDPDEITGTNIDDIEISSLPDFGDDEITGTSLEEEDDTMEEAVGIDASAEAIRGEVIKLIDKFDNDEDLGMAVRNKFSK